jgi:hypothetical protein
LPAIGLPGRDDPKGVRLAVRVDDDQEIARIAEAEGDEPLLAHGLGSLSELLVEDRG